VYASTTESLASQGGEDVKNDKDSEIKNSDTGVKYSSF